MKANDVVGLKSIPEEFLSHFEKQREAYQVNRYPPYQERFDDLKALLLNMLMPPYAGRPGKN